MTAADMVSVVLQPSDEVALPAIAPDLVDAARSYAAAGMAENTRRAYKADLRDFVAWCASVGRPSMPASAETVALYLTAKAGTVSVATLSRRLAAIRTAHRLADQPQPSSGAMEQVWAGIRRQHGKPARPKRALVTDDLRRVLLAIPNTLAGKRDRALLLVGFSAALRRSELAALEVDEPDAGPVRVRFVAEGFDVYLDRAKADQEGEGAIVSVPFGNAETCPVRALRAWLEAGRIESGPIFRPIDRWGAVANRAITDNVVANVVKAATGRVGLDPTAFAGHSLRAGLATSAAANDAPAHLIMEHLRHTRFETTRRYIREGERFKRNAAGMAGI